VESVADGSDVADGAAPDAGGTAAGPDQAQAASGGGPAPEEVPTLVSPRAQAALAGEPDPLEAVPPQVRDAAWPRQSAASEQDDAPNTVTVTSLEVGRLSQLAADQPPASAYLVAREAAGRPAGPAPDPELADKVRELTEENQGLKSRLAVLEAQNELLRERLKYNDDLILNLTGGRR
jgi:hypothetical protein